ncbi:MAG: hypothetical protein K1Y02_14045 [Candidatus Hydrogenedentes bacterium]|nr:hypothetical protein [Candidatus Hydrogenedentota bacterium]
MNKQTKKLILLGVLGLVALFFVLRPFLTQSEQDRIYQENFKKAQQEAAAGGPATPATPAGQPAAAAKPAGAPNGAAANRSQFQKAEVDIDALIASIQEVTFDYDQERTRINPMTPLVGPMAPMRLAVSQPGAEGQETSQEDVQQILRNLRLTGILWDKRDPMAVINDDIVTRGFEFPDTGVKVHDIEKDRVILNLNNVLVPLEMEER